ncbi:hypothetical protein ACWEOZ_32165 [Actinoplanes sp. NPDC004185]
MAPASIRQFAPILLGMARDDSRSTAGDRVRFDQGAGEHAALARHRGEQRPVADAHALRQLGGEAVPASIR